LENGKITDKQIVQLLLDHEHLTVGDLGKLLGAEDKLPGITYHLKGLTERNIVQVQQKKKSSIYRLNGKYV
jgi:predicted ArsR family transcriptional regulator